MMCKSQPDQGDVRSSPSFSLISTKLSAECSNKFFIKITVEISETNETNEFKNLEIHQIIFKIFIQMFPQEVGSLIYLLIFIIRPTKGCDERAITAPLPALETKSSMSVWKQIPPKLKCKQPQYLHFYLADTK